MKLSDIRKACRAEHGLGFDDTEDPLFTNLLLNAWINDEHRKLAFDTRCYRVTQALDLPEGADGVSWVPLPPNVFDVIPDTVRFWNGSDWTDLCYQPEEQLLHWQRPLETFSNSTPRYYYPRVGSTLAAARGLVLWPGSSVRVDAGLRVGTYVYPPPMTDDQETPALQPAEHTAIVRAVVARMAGLSYRQSGGQASLANVQQGALAEAGQASARVKEAVEQGKRIGPRRIHWRG